MPTEPVSIVEISSSLPGDAPVWVDVSSSFRGAKTKRGKQRQQDKSTAGTATFVFSNADRKFDPENAAGALYAFLKPMRRIRLRATWNAVTYPVFDGYIDFIEQGYDGPHESFATIAATDGFKRLESAYLPSVWETVMETETSVKAWFRLDEPTEDSVAIQPLADRSGNGYVAYKVGDVDSTNGLLTDDPNPALHTPNTGISGIALPSSLTPLALPWAIEFWIKAPRYADTGAPFGTFAYIVRPFGVEGDILGTQGTLFGQTRNTVDGFVPDLLNFAVGPINAPTSFVESNVPIFDDQIHHVVLVGESGVWMRLYIDGVDRTGVVSGNSEPLTTQTISLGVAAVEATWDEVRIYQGTVPDATDIAMHYESGSAPWSGDLPHERITRVLDLIDWPSADRVLSTDGSPLQRTGLGGSALEHLLLIEETELGAIFVTADGKVRYYSRDDLITGSFTASQATLGDAIGETGYVEMSGYRLSDDMVRNVIRRHREEGAEVVAQDAASILEYGPKTESSSGTQETSDSIALDRANYRLSLVKDALSHVNTLGLEPRQNPTVLFPLILGTLDLQSRITIRRRPQNVGALIEQATSIQGIEHDIGPKKWRTSYYLDATASSASLGYFLFDDTLWGDPDWRFSAA